MNYPPFTAIYFHPQFGPSYSTLHTIEEFRAITRMKNCVWSKLIDSSNGSVVDEHSNPSALPEPIPSQETSE